jgi:putative transposase
MKKRFTEEQIAFAMRQAEAGTPVTEVCRKMGVSEQSFYRWKRKYEGMGVAELRRLRQLEEENRKLKKLVADLSLDKHILQEVLAVPGAGCAGRLQAHDETCVPADPDPAAYGLLPEPEEDLGRASDPIEGPGSGPGSVWVSTIACSVAP